MIAAKLLSCIQLQRARISATCKPLTIYAHVKYSGKIKLQQSPGECMSTVTSALASFAVLGLGVFCTTLFFESIYTALRGRGHHRLKSIALISIGIVGAFFLLDYLGIFPLFIRTACW